MYGTPLFFMKIASLVASHGPQLWTQVEKRVLEIHEISQNHVLQVHEIVVARQMQVVLAC